MIELKIKSAEELYKELTEKKQTVGSVKEEPIADLFKDATEADLADFKKESKTHETLNEGWKLVELRNDLRYVTELNRKRSELLEDELRHLALEQQEEEEDEEIRKQLGEEFKQDPGGYAEKEYVKNIPIVRKGLGLKTLSEEENDSRKLKPAQELFDELKKKGVCHSERGEEENTR